MTRPGGLATNWELRPLRLLVYNPSLFEVFVPLAEASKSVAKAAGLRATERGVVTTELARASGIITEVEGN